MGFNFTKFTDVDATFAARITIRQTGQFGVNSGAINRYKINDFSHVVLYFDAERRAVGIQLLTETAEGAIEIKKSDTNTYIRAKNFCDCNGIDYTKLHRFELRYDPESGFLVFELGKELTSKESEAD